MVLVILSKENFHEKYVRRFEQFDFFPAEFEHREYLVHISKRQQFRKVSLKKKKNMNSASSIRSFQKPS